MSDQQTNGTGLDGSAGLDFSAGAADSVDDGNTQLQEAGVADGDDFDTAAHRRQRVEELRDRAVDAGFELRASALSGEIPPPTRGRDNDGVQYIDSADRRARTLFREATISFVRESFQILASPHVDLSRDYQSEAPIGVLVSEPPDEFVEEIRDLNFSGSTIEELIDEHDEEKKKKIIGLREFVEVKSPLVFEHHAGTLWDHHGGSVEITHYYDVCELSWQDIHAAIEFTTKALAEAGIGFEFEESNEWEL